MRPVLASAPSWPGRRLLSYFRALGYKHNILSTRAAYRSSRRCRGGRRDQRQRRQQSKRPSSSEVRSAISAPAHFDWRIFYRHVKPKLALGHPSVPGWCQQTTSCGHAAHLSLPLAAARASPPLLLPCLPAPSLSPSRPQPMAAHVRIVPYCAPGMHVPGASCPLPCQAQSPARYLPPAACFSHALQPLQASRCKACQWDRQQAPRPSALWALGSWWARSGGLRLSLELLPATAPAAREPWASSSEFLAVQTSGRESGSRMTESNADSLKQIFGLRAAAYTHPGPSLKAGSVTVVTVTCAGLLSVLCNHTAPALCLQAGHGLPFQGCGQERGGAGRIQRAQHQHHRHAAGVRVCHSTCRLRAGSAWQ